MMSQGRRFLHVPLIQVNRPLRTGTGLQFDYRCAGSVTNAILAMPARCASAITSATFS